MTREIQLNRLHSQRGAVLVVSLLLLLVMTMLALGASQATRMDERLAGNARDRDIAFQSAEAGLRAGERLIDNPALTAAPYPCSTAPCEVYELGVLTTDVGYQDWGTWWNLNAWDYAPSAQISALPLDGGGVQLSAVATREPVFFIEELEEVTDSLTIPPTGPPPSRMYYRITSNGAGATANAQVVLQSTFARRFN
jgi:type IV pilus assembly protein PilX